MLQVFHNFKKSYVIILLVLVVAFVMTGFGLNMGSSRKNFAAVTINGEDISYQDFYRERQNMERRYRQVFGENYDTFAANLRLNQQIIDGLIAKKLLESFAKEIGLVPSRDGVRKILLGSGLFQQGYDQNLYKAYLQQLGMTSTQFEGELEVEALTEQLSELVQNVSYASKQETEVGLIRAETSFDAEYVTFSPENYTSGIKDPSLEDLQKFYEDNSTDYETAPAVAYHYVVYDPEEWKSKVEVMPEDIEFYYTENESRFKLPEQVKVSRILFNFGKNDTPAKMADLKTKAEEVHNKASVGEDFSSLAQIHSDDFISKTLGGDIGWIERGTPAYPKEIVNAAFSLKVGEVSQLISTDSGYEIIKVTDKKEASLKDLDSVRAEIERSLREEQAPSYAAAKAHDFFDAWLKSGRPIDQFALTDGTTVRVTSELLEAGNDPENLTGLTAEVLKSPDLKEQMVELGDKTILVGIKEYAPSEVPALENIKPKVLEAWRKKESQRLAEEAANSLVKAMKDGAYKSLSEAAKTLSLTLASEKGLTRGKSSPLPFSDPALQNELFSTIEARAVPSRSYLIAGKRYVFQVTNLNLPDTKSIAGKIEQARTQESQKLGQMLLSSIVNELKSKAEIQISDSIDLNA